MRFSTHTAEAVDGRYFWIVKVCYNGWDWHVLASDSAADEDLAEARASTALSLHSLTQGSSSCVKVVELGTLETFAQ